jgi:hypothetical protein
MVGRASVEGRSTPQAETELTSKCVVGRQVRVWNGWHVRCGWEGRHGTFGDDQRVATLRERHNPNVSYYAYVPVFWPGAAYVVRHTMRISCSVESSSDINWIKTHLHINMRPFEFPPSKTLVMGLFTADAKGGLLEVQAIKARPEWRNDEVLDGAFGLHEDDVLKCLRALSSESDLFFAVYKTTPTDREPLIARGAQPLFKLQFPNDQNFKRLYAESCERVARGQDGTRARHLHEGWYRRRTFEH